MRILCVGTSETGGAGVAMRRLVDSLRSAGATVDILALRQADACHVDFSETPTRLTAVKQVHRHIRRGLRRSRTSQTNTIFTLDWPAWDVASHPAVADADIINLHWVSAFLNPATILRLVETQKPVVWTLHDQRAFTGGCHYTAGCDGFVGNCGQCPQLFEPINHVASRLLKASRDTLHEAPMTFVTPSRWLGRELRRSSLFNASCHRHHVIPYDLDLTRFAPRNTKPELREKFSLPAQGLGIVLGSVSLDEQRKGFVQARAALEELATRLATARHAGPKPFVITFGHGKPTLEGLSCHHLGPQDEEGVISIFNAADVFLMMTREDNLPNTVMEALACGVPVIGTRVGGVPDMVEHGHQGWLVERDDSSAAADTLFDLVSNPHQLRGFAIAARRHAEHCFAATLQAEKYLELFEDLLAGTRQSPAPIATGIPPLRMVRLTPAATEIVARRARCRGPRRAMRRLLSRIRSHSPVANRASECPNGSRRSNGRIK